MHRLIILTALAVPSFVAAQDDAMYEKHKLRWTEVDGKFYPVPAIPKKIDAMAQPQLVKVGGVGKVEIKIAKVREGKDDLVGHLIHPLTGKPNPLIRVKGQSTEGLIDGARIRDAEIVVVGTTDVKLTDGSSQKIFLAVTVDKAKAGLTKEQFAELVKSGVKLD